MSGLPWGRASAGFRMVLIMKAVSIVNSNSARLNRKQMSLPVRSFPEAPADHGLGHNIPDVSVPEFCASSLL